MTKVSIKWTHAILFFFCFCRLISLLIIIGFTNMWHFLSCHMLLQDVPDLYVFKNIIVSRKECQIHSDPQQHRVKKIRVYVSCLNPIQQLVLSSGYNFLIYLFRVFCRKYILSFILDCWSIWSENVHVGQVLTISIFLWHLRHYEQFLNIALFLLAVVTDLADLFS